MLSNARKYYDTIKHLKLTQIYGQIIFRFKKPTIKISKISQIRNIVKKWQHPIFKPSHGYDGKKISFLNQEKDISSSCIWSDVKIDKLWLYNLHYFDVLNEKQISVDHAQFIERWIIENEPGKSCGWEPYPISLRIVNWIKWFLAGNKPTNTMLLSLATQSRFLSKRIEIHLLGNHVLANAKALLFAGLYFDGNEANRWYKKGLKIFNKELTRQILPDGAHVELSPMYHHIILEDLLDVINIFSCYGKNVPRSWLEINKKMFEWASAMSHPDQQIAFFNDAALGVAPTLEELNEYQKNLNLSIKPYKFEPLTYLPDSGYCRLQKGKALLLIDMADVGVSYQPGHAHADTLSFELSLGQQRLIVNSGTSCYAENGKRYAERSTASHNTLVVDDQNSSEIWKSFRVARRAKVRYVDIKESKDKCVIKASHDGYYHQDKIFHHRTWSMNDSELIIEDQVTGFGKHKVALNFHIHPDIIVRQGSDKSVFFYNDSDQFIASLNINAVIQLQDDTYHPEFNLSIKNKKIFVEVHQRLPVYLKTIIQFSL